jgi:hypothetical protein
LRPRHRETSRNFLWHQNRRSTHLVTHSGDDQVEEIARWWRRRYGDDPVREMMLKEALEADGLELPEEKPEERARRQRLQAARERSGKG